MSLVAILSFVILVALVPLTQIQRAKSRRNKKRESRPVLWKTVWNREGIELPGYLIADGYDLIAFVPNMDHHSEKVAAKIARDPRHAARHQDNHAVIFDLRGTSMEDESNAGFLNKLLYPLRRERGYATRWPASEFMFDAGFGAIMLFTYTDGGLEHRLKNGPRSQTEEVPFIGHGYAGDGFARVKPGKEIETDGMIFGRDSDSFEPVSQSA